MKATLRRRKYGDGEAQVLDFGRLRIDLGAQRVLVDDSEVNLTPIEFQLLAALAGRVGRVFTRDQLISTVWKERYATDERVVDTHIASLRKKVEPANGPHWIATVRGAGYRFEPPSS